MLPRTRITRFKPPHAILMKLHTGLVGLCVVAFWLSGVDQASSQVNPFRSAPTGTDTRTDAYPQAGFGFAANPSGTAQINALGFWVSPLDSGGTGVTAVDHTIAIYNYNGGLYTELAQAIVPAGSTADASGYAWINILPLTLTDTRQSRDYYAVLASEGTDFWIPYTDNSGTTDLDTSFGNSTGNGVGGDSFVAPGVGNSIPLYNFGFNGGYVGPNIGFGTPVPEPSCAMLMLGSGSLLLLRRRRSLPNK